MLARITTFHAQEGRLDDVLAIIQGEISQAVRAKPGCLGVTILVDRSDHRGMFIAYWDSEERITELENSGFWESQVAKGVFLIAEVPTREVYDVVAVEGITLPAGI